MKGLIIKKEWVDLILTGDKTWEMRSKNTDARGLIGLIESGSQTVVGVCSVVDSLGFICKECLKKTTRYHRVSDTSIDKDGFKYNFPWVLDSAIRLKEAVSYQHKPGQVIWVNFSDEVKNKVLSQLE
jgi:hypothetical protein